MKLGDLQPQICPHMWKLVDLSSLKNKHLLSLVFPFHRRLPTAYKWILLCNQRGGKLAFYLFINSPEQILHTKAHFLFFFFYKTVLWFCNYHLQDAMLQELLKSDIDVMLIFYQKSSNSQLLTCMSDISLLPGSAPYCLCLMCLPLPALSLSPEPCRLNPTAICHHHGVHFPRDRSCS